MAVGGALDLARFTRLAAVYTFQEVTALYPVKQGLYLFGAGLAIWAYGIRIAATLVLLICGMGWLIAGSWRALHVRAAGVLLRFLAQGVFVLPRYCRAVERL